VTVKHRGGASALDRRAHKDAGLAGPKLSARPDVQDRAQLHAIRCLMSEEHVELFVAK